MVPKDAQDLAVVRMVELVAVNKLIPTMYSLSREKMGWGTPEPEEIANAKEKVNTVLKFFEGLLDDRPFFGSNDLTLAECIAGNVVPWMFWVGFSLDGYPKIAAWCDRSQSRPSWQQTQLTEADMAAFASRRQKFLAQPEV